MPYDMGDIADSYYRDPTGEQVPAPADAELLRSLRISWEERGRILDKLLVARMIDLAMVASLIDRSPNSMALSELRGVILEAIELIKTIRLEGKAI